MRYKKIRMPAIAAVVILIIMCLVVFVYGSAQVSAASKAKKSLSSDRVSLKSGRTCVLRVKNADKKVKWTTSDKSIVRITKKSGKYDQKVRLRAGDKEGTCLVKAKLGKLNLKCRVTVRKNSEDDPIPTPGEGFSERITDFSVKLLQKTVQYDKANGRSSNMLVSPDSVITALGMLENGADGETLAQLEGLTGGLGVDALGSDLRAFHKRLSGYKKPLYTSANSIWSNKDYVTAGGEFREKCRQYYDAEIFERTFDEAAKNEMNSWVKDNTRGMIKDIIDRLDPDDRIILINALAFEGKWAEQFENSQVTKEDFTEESGKTDKKVNMLNETLCGRGTYIELNGGKGLVKDYENGTTAFVAILPPEGTKLDDFISGLTGPAFSKAWNSRQDKPVRIKIPEFKYDYDASLKNVLGMMGVSRAFTDFAEFAKMTGTPMSLVKVDDVLHKTHIELDRNGTKAAAATAVVAKAGSAPFDQDIREVYLNRPFVYALVDKSTGIPFFIGALRTAK